MVKSFLEGFPSGQWEQAVNLPAYAFVGSNPTPSTVPQWISISGSAAPGQQHWPKPTELSVPLAESSRRRSQTSLERMPSSQFEGLVRRTSSSDAPARRPASRSADGSRAPTASSLISAGVAQLVERQPSKLNVASSNLVSRSVFIARGRPNPRGFSVPTDGRSALPKGTCSRVDTHGRSRPRVSPAHLAQLVEHVLGKDEVISSILMVGSKSIASACGVLRSAAA